MSVNDITGDNIISRNLSEQGRSNWDMIFKKKENMKPTYYLFLDDVRTPCKATFEDGTSLCEFTGIDQVDWKIVRSYDDFVSMVTHVGIPETVSFDHDLCEEHMKQYLFHMKDDVFDYEASSVKTGYHCALFLKEQCDTLGVHYPTVYSHSFNHIGRNNIYSIFYGSNN